ncbi:MAG TPA: hypothetical protein VN428_20800 [Bryobacteraceae bacterium]|nr:hypothetical protein [Bryobacteraceae bacterium]
MKRREFIFAAAAGPALKALQGSPLPDATVLGGLRTDKSTPAPIPGATWYIGNAENDGLAWTFPAGTLAGARHIASDMLLDGTTLANFTLELQEGENGRKFRFSFGALNQASFRFRMPLDATDQNRWRLDREGAYLKPRAGGDRVDLEKVDRMRLLLGRKAAGPARWCMTPLYVSDVEVEKLPKPVLPKGKLIDELGQSTLHSWKGRTRDLAELKARLQSQLAAAPKQAWPENFSRWGGWKAKKLGQGTGFFRTHNDGRRWWLADPDGYAYWSAGCDCIRVDCDGRFDGLESALTWLPEREGEFAAAYLPFNRTSASRGSSISYLAANFIRAFGAQEWRDKWAEIALAELRRLRFNTVGSWSEWEFAAKQKFPYTRPMNFSPSRSKLVYRDFPDVYHAGFEPDATDYASQLKSTANDPAFIGYFLMNEPTWGFSTELPAAGMLYNTETCASREELTNFLKQKYSDNAALASGWKMPATFERVAKGKWREVLTPEAISDLRAFSTRMVERYFRVLSAACRKADPNHLNLGMRWAGVPPEWAVEGMKSFDVFSLNCYMQKLPLERATKIHEMLKMPVMVGEWHFGALDVGLPASGIGHVKTQEDRGKAYRVYLEDAAADPYCVGAHWFTLYDQSALGRFDGENYNIGFLDICNRPYPEISAAAASAHELMYEIAAGKVEPYADAPEYLPLVFL